ncbi:MAG: YitT family protein, partial [Bacteroidales bacterium]|nr:YitT family protein [Bacteroidales bacterium]
VIYFMSGNVIPVAYSYFIINIGLLAIALKILGKSFGIKTVFGIVVSSIFFFFLQKYITEPVVKERFMAAIIGGVMSGSGIALTFTQGGSSGGTDIIALIINKYRNYSPGSLILIMDIIIIGSSFFVWTDKPMADRIETLMYGGVMMAVVAYSIDMVVTGASKSLQLFVFSTKYEAIAERITKEKNRGVTVMDGVGWHSKKDQKVLVIMIRKAESSGIYSIIKQEDPEAFMSVSSVMGVYGKGFDLMKK